MSMEMSGIGGLSPFGNVPSSPPVPDRDRLVELLKTKGDGSRVLIQTLMAIRDGHYPKAANTPEVAVAIQSHARHDNSTVRVLVKEARERIILNGPPGTNLWFSNDAIVREMASADTLGTSIVDNSSFPLLIVPRVFSRNQGPEELLRRLNPETDPLTFIPHVLAEIISGDHESGVHTVEVVRRLGELLQHDNSSISRPAGEILGKIAISRRYLLREAGINPLTV